MEQRKEDEVKEMLHNIWKKDIVRVKNYANGWQEKTVSLGKGIVRIQGLEKIQIILDEIEDFGIDMEALNAIEPKYDELYEIYQAILSYRRTVRYLKKLKGKMQSKEMEKY